MIHTRRFQGSAGFVLRLFSSGMWCSGTSQKHRDLTIHITVTKIISYQATLAQWAFRNDLDTSCCFTKYKAVRLRELSLDSVVIVCNSTTRWPQSCMPAKNCYVITKSKGSDLVVGVKVQVKQLQKWKAIVMDRDRLCGSCLKKGIKPSNIKCQLHAI